MRFRVWALALLLAGAAGAQDAWHIQDAAVRFTVQLAAPPTHPSCGYFLHLPDGGALPGPTPVPRVLGTDGTELKSFVLWHSRQDGIALVFAPPDGAREVLVYVLGMGRPVLWTPASGLTPSAILAVRSGAGQRPDAYALSRPGEVEGSVAFFNRAGHPKAPLAISGDLTGREGPNASFLLAYVDVKKPGEHWFAPLTFAGGAEVRVDGKALAPKQVNKKAGGTGEAIELSAGLHRVEVLAWAPDSKSQNGVMTLTWRPPGTPAGELGGNRPSDLPYAGTPMWESRPLKENEIARSGRAVIGSARARDGGPVARVNVEALENFWVENEPPLLLCRVKAEAAGAPSDTRYTWTFEGGGQIAKPEAQWLFMGGRDHTVLLTAESGKRRSVARHTFHPFGTMQTSLENSTTRANFRQAALDMLEAFPAGQDAIAAWTPSHWNNLFRTLDLNQGRALIAHLFQVRRPVLERKLAPDQLALLREVFLDFLPRVSPEQALEWAALFEKEARDGHQAALMRLQRVEYLLFYLNRPDEARRLLESLTAGGRADDASEWARIRLGDAEFMAGKLNEATRLYADVQGRVKKRRTKFSDAAPEMNLAGKSSMEISAALRAGLKPTGGSPDAKVADWKVSALLDAADSENVKSLVSQGYLLEARQALREWERDFPMSKISGDFILNEARFYMALKDWKRAAAMLSPYCEQIDASSYIPAAVEALLECQERLNLPKAERLAFCERMKKKLEFHPVVEKINDAMDDLKAAP